MTEIRLNVVRIGRMGWRVLHCERVVLVKEGDFSLLYISWSDTILATTDDNKLERPHRARLVNYNNE